MMAIEGSSIYARSRAPLVATPGQAIRSRYDAVVIGGGVMGLSAARALQAEGLEVLVIDRAGIATEAAGSRNGGQLIPGMHLAKMRRLFATMPTFADSLVQASYAMVQAIKDFVPRAAALGYELEFARGGTATVYRPRQKLAFAADRDYLAGLGFELWLEEDKSRVAAATGAAGFNRMVVNPLGASVNPQQLLLAEAADFLQKGGHIFPNQAVDRLKTDAADIIVQVAGKTLRAPQLVLAVGAALGDLCRKSGLERVLGLIPPPVRLAEVAAMLQEIKHWPEFAAIQQQSLTVGTQMLALSPTPLLQDVRLAVSTPGGNCEYWRVDACNRLLFGGDALVPGAFEIGSQHLEERLRHLFPSLRAALAWGDVRVEARWRGSDTLTTSALPYPMEVESSGGARIAVLTGGNGEGNVTGRTIAALAAKAHVRQDENFFDAFKGLNQPFIGGAFPAAVALWLEHVLDADGLAAQLQAAVYRGRDRS